MVENSLTYHVVIIEFPSVENNARVEVSERHPKSQEILSMHCDQNFFILILANVHVH